jgi:hypothetical protein
MPTLLVSHACLGLGTPAPILFLPSLAALIEGALISMVCGYPILLGSGMAIALVAAIQAGYVVGSLVWATDAMKAAR